MTNEEIQKVADYYIKNAPVSMKETAEHFGLSKKTIQIWLNEKLFKIDPDKWKLVNDVKEQNQRLGTIKGGQNGKPTKHPIAGEARGSYIFTPEELEKLSDAYINGASLRTLEDRYGVAKSTIGDNLNTLAKNDPELRDALDSRNNHKR